MKTFVAARPKENRLQWKLRKAQKEGVKPCRIAKENFTTVKDRAVRGLYLRHFFLKPDIFK